MGEGWGEIRERIEAAVDRTIQMALTLPANLAGRETGRQIIRSVCSVAANLEEARAAGSRDNAYRLGVSPREGRGTLYWLRRIGRNGLLPENRTTDPHGEWHELVAILTRAVRTLRMQATL